MISRFVPPSANSSDGLDDLDVSRAAAEVSRDCLTYLCDCGVGLRIEQGLGREKHAGRAEAALSRAVLMEASLKRIERRALAQSFYSRYLPSSGCRRQNQARIHRASIEQNCASAAFAGVTSPLRAGDTEVEAQRLQ